MIKLKLVLIYSTLKWVYNNYKWLYTYMLSEKWGSFTASTRWSSLGIILTFKRMIYKVLMIFGD